MKKFISRELIDQLQADTRFLLAQATRLKQVDPGKLLQQPDAGKWSVVQVIEHLNSYGRYYLPALSRSLIRNIPAQQYFKPGMIGNYFTNLMKPGEQGILSKKMKAPKGHRPPADLDAHTVLDEFIDQQQELLQLLEKARSRDIGKLKTPISISRFIRLKTGDTFRFLIGHEQRHFVQVENILKD